MSKVNSWGTECMRWKGTQKRKKKKKKRYYQTKIGIMEDEKEIGGLHNKGKEDIIIVAVNIASISIHYLYKVGELMQNAEKLDIDMFMISEHNLNFSHSNLFIQVSRMVRFFWPHYAMIASSTPDKFDGTYQPGGTLLMVNKKSCKKIKCKGKDPLGRWTWEIIQGKCTSNYFNYSICNITINRDRITHLQPATE